MASITGSGAIPMFPLASRSRQVRGRHRAQFDTLESRIALSIDGVSSDAGTFAPTEGTTAEVGSQSQDAPLSVDLASPIPGSVLFASPVSLVLEFNRPILPDSLAPDVEIVQTDSDGNLTWILQPDKLSLDATSTRLSVVLSQTLAPGDYQVRVSGMSGISDIDGNPLIPDGNDLILGQFEVAVPGVTLMNAVDLGKLGPTPIEVPEALDFQTAPHGVSLYRIQLESGHFWRLGLEVTAQRDGGSLDSALSLFDDQGKFIASDEVGRTDAPKDPYFFAGLQPGTYYVGVSGVGNRPGMPGGYDPATGSPGSVPQTQKGGPYTLHVVADPVDTPPQVLRFALDHADPSDLSPTGLTLGFSRALSLTNQYGDLVPSLSKSIEVLDQGGRGWPVQVSTYSEADAKISYLFDEFLPPGHYIVKLPEQGGLVDLAGLSPVAAGEPSGVLGQFDVVGRRGEPNPLDLAALLPAAATAGVSIDLILSQGQSITYRVVVTVPGLYSLQEQSSGDPPSVQITGPDLDRPLSPTGTDEILLSPGVYSIRFEAPTGAPVHVHFFFRLPLQTDMLLANGVGQGPALSLRLITFSEVTGTPPPVSITPPVFGPFPIALPAAIALGTTDSLAGSTAGSIRADPQTLRSIPFTGTPAATTSFLGMGSDLVGRPSVPAHGSESSQRQAVAGTDLGSFHGLVRGQSLKAFPAGPARFLWESASPTGGNLEDPGARPPAQATMISFDLRRAIATAVSLRRWAILQGEFFLSWAGSWSGERPTSEATSIRLTGLIPGLGPRQPGVGSQPNPGGQCG